MTRFEFAVWTLREWLIVEEARMIGRPRGVTVYAFDDPCDMRKSFDTSS